ncbi:MAG: hypothetical protein RIB63_17190, partial [Fulvivirga sp.]
MRIKLLLVTASLLMSMQNKTVAQNISTQSTTPAYSGDIYHMSGNVGLGTISPIAFGTDAPTLDLRGARTTRTGAIQAFSSDQSIGWSIGRADDSSLPDGLVISTIDIAPINFMTGSNNRFTISSSGNIGIGTILPTSFGTDAPTLDLRGSRTTRTGAIQAFSSDQSIGWSIGRADD